jgi:ferric iron reductase protein FhuF
MHNPRQTAHITRRRALQTVAAASAFAVPAALVAVNEARAYDPDNEERRARYRETDHVNAFYRVNGYETLKK